MIEATLRHIQFLKDHVGERPDGTPVTLWDDLCARRLLEAYWVAAKDSEDLSTNLGAVLVQPNSMNIVTRGANRLSPGLAKLDERFQRPLKYQYTEHAERVAIYQAARNGIVTEGLWMFCPWASCSDCSRAIIEAGIEVLVVHNQMMESCPDRWLESVMLGHSMMREAGVIIEVWNGKFEDILPGQRVPSILFNEQPWTPD